MGTKKTSEELPKQMFEEVIKRSQEELLTLIDDFTSGIGIVTAVEHLNDSLYNYITLTSIMVENKEEDQGFFCTNEFQNKIYQHKEILEFILAVCESRQSTIAYCNKYHPSDN